MAWLRRSISPFNRLKEGCSRSKYQVRESMKSDWRTCSSSREVSMYAEYEYRTESVRGRTFSPEKEERRESHLETKPCWSKSGSEFRESSPMTVRICKL